MKNIVIVSHKYVTQPDDELAVYLNQRKFDNVIHIRHSFNAAPDRRSWFTWFKSGVLYKEVRSADYKWLPGPLVYLKEIFFTLKWLLLSGVRWDFYVGMDGLCVLMGNILRGLGRVGKTAYWVMDFVPEKRFSSGISNALYHRINTLGYANSDEMWDISPRMAEAREEFLGFDRWRHKKHLIVPYGVWSGRVKKYRYEECQQNTLVFMGVLMEKQGVQNIIRALPEIIRKKPDFRFKIVGGGDYMETLQRLAEELHVSAYCDFKGRMEKIEDLEKEVACSCAGIAPYVKELDTCTYYADPGKVKTYLACGIPALLTDIPWNAEEIEKAGCGKIITLDVPGIVNGILEIMDPERNQRYRDNAVVYSQGFDYTHIFGSLSLHEK